MEKKMNEIETISYENATDVIKEIQEAFYNIPFENSGFQTENFVIAAQITPERAYRSIGLRMQSKLEALTAASFSREMQKIDLDEIDYKLNHTELDQFERRRLEIKKRQSESSNAWSNKLINDAIVELNLLYKYFKAFPKYTREQFENSEKLHFEQKLTRQVVGLEGAKEALVNMNEDLSAIKQYQEGVKLIENLSTENLLLLSEKLPNLLKQQENLGTKI